MKNVFKNLKLCQCFKSFNQIENNFDIGILFIFKIKKKKKKNQIKFTSNYFCPYFISVNFLFSK